MSVLIKGMEMPKNCEECDVKVVCKNYWKLIREQYTRPSWCPLGPVPPHGRCIDADALLMRINHEVMEAYMDGVCYGVHPNQEYLNLLGEIIDDAPTIIPADEDTSIQKEFMQNWHEEDEW